MAANPKTTRPAFGPEAQARREKREAREAQRKQVLSKAVVDVFTPHASEKPDAHDAALDGGAELATKRSATAVELGRPLRPSERRKLRREHREQAGKPPAGQSAGQRRPDIAARLEPLSPAERDRVIESMAGDPEVQAFVIRKRAELEEAEEEAEYLLAVEREEAALQNIADEEEFDWETLDTVEVEPDEGEPWGAGLTAPEQQALRDLEAAESYGELEASYDSSGEDE
jgi:hypothetical protein